MQLSIFLKIKCVLVVTYVTFNHLEMSHFPKGILFLSTAFMKDLTMISCLGLESISFLSLPPLISTRIPWTITNNIGVDTKRDFLI